VRLWGWIGGLVNQRSINRWAIFFRPPGLVRGWLEFMVWNWWFLDLKGATALGRNLYWPERKPDNFFHLDLP
jgi:hypothetical protein